MRQYLIRMAIRYKGDYFKIADAIKKQEKADESIALQDAITIVDDDYPECFRQLKYPPFVLFYKGNKELLKKKKIAVVGAREVSEYGEKVTVEIIRKLKYDYVIVSGMAKGVDSIVHNFSYDTIGVLANGLDIIYPKENQQLYSYMKTAQLLITEYPLNVRAVKYYFPFRNRLIAALADDGVIVTQAKIRSGTMHTVNEALQLNKEIYAVPYPLFDENGCGCNLLIQQGANMIIYDEEHKCIENFI